MHIHKLLLDLTEEVFDFFLVKIKIAVPGDAERDGRSDMVAGEEALDKALDDVAQKDVDVGFTPASRTYFDDAREYARDGNNCHEALDDSGLRVVYRRQNVERFVR